MRILIAEDDQVLAAGLLRTLRSSVGQVIVGQEDAVEAAVVCLFAGGHLLIEGVPGTGKTLLQRWISCRMGRRRMPL